MQCSQRSIAFFKNDIPFFSLRFLAIKRGLGGDVWSLPLFISSSENIWVEKERVCVMFLKGRLDFK